MLLCEKYSRTRIWITGHTRTYEVTNFTVGIVGEKYRSSHTTYSYIRCSSLTASSVKDWSSSPEIFTNLFLDKPSDLDSLAEKVKSLYKTTVMYGDWIVTFVRLVYNIQYLYNLQKKYILQTKVTIATQIWNNNVLHNRKRIHDNL